MMLLPDSNWPVKKHLDSKPIYRRIVQEPCKRFQKLNWKLFPFSLEFTWKYVAYFLKKIKFMKLQCQEVKLWNSKKMALKGI